jgi:adenine modification enzyme
MQANRLATIGPRNVILEAGAIVGYGTDQFQVRNIPRSTAAEIIRRHHNSGRIVNNSYVHLGVFMGGELMGALQFGYAMNPASGKSIVTGTGNRAYLELNRMWIDDAVPANGESAALSYAIRYIKRVLPQVGWIQSFADERCGGAGIVYQAANFIYCGCHRTRFFHLDGEWYHEMMQNRRAGGGGRALYLQTHITRAVAHTFRQFRYLYFIDRRLMALLRLKVLPYPKPVTP